MASGARPSSNQRSENALIACDSGGGGGNNGDANNSSENIDTKKYPNKNNTINSGTGGRKLRAHVPSSDFCVVCGDRACSHHYYGVAACHGCKCFFWRSIKQKQQYICRYNGNCQINMNHRNSCRFCRFQRCLNAGMQPEAVRMQKTDSETSLLNSNNNNNNTLAIQIGVKRPISSSFLIDPSKQSEVEETFQFSELASSKKSRMDNVELIQQLINCQTQANEEADFSENEAPKRRVTLDAIFQFPELLECYRTRVNFCVRLRKVTLEELEFCKYRTMAHVYDYIRAIENVLVDGKAPNFSVRDKIVLLRGGFAPLTLFEIANGTVQATKDSNLLCLPTGITLSRHEEIILNSFITQKIINNVIDTLVRVLAELHLDQQESSILKAVLLLNTDSIGDARLSIEAEEYISKLRDRVHAALYQHCTNVANSNDVSNSSAALRFAKLLHLLPKLTLLSRDLIEHIKMLNTFTTDQKPIDPIFLQLFGDIFQEETIFTAQHNSTFVNVPSPSVVYKNEGRSTPQRCYLEETS